MAVTLKDIAEATGVSIGTVDRALKNRGRINPEVADRIRKKAAEMNYMPNRIASGLARKNRQCRIAVIFSVRPGGFWNSVIDGIQKAQDEVSHYGFTIAMYFGSGFDARVQLELIDRAIAEGAGAIIIVPVNDSRIAQRLREVTAAGTPVVFLNSYLENVDCLTSIHCDYYRSGRIAAALVKRLAGGEGHALAFVPSSKMLGNNYRIEGIRDSFNRDMPVSLDALTELSMDPEQDMIMIRQVVDAHPEAEYIIFNGDLTAYKKALGQRLQRVHTIFFDMMADSGSCLLAGEIDAVITQDQELQGSSAVEAIFRYLSDGIVPPRETIIECRIVLKECID